jgi:hypothetical protein
MSFPSVVHSSRYQKPKNNEITKTIIATTLCALHKELFDCPNEMTQSYIYTNLGAYLGPTYYSESSNYFIIFNLLLVGPTSLPRSSISSWEFCNGVDGSSCTFL